jgi:hypothetical protein
LSHRMCQEVRKEIWHVLRRDRAVEEEDLGRLRLRGG